MRPPLFLLVALLALPAGGQVKTNIGATAESGSGQIGSSLNSGGAAAVLSGTLSPSLAAPGISLSPALAPSALIVLPPAAASIPDKSAPIAVAVPLKAGTKSVDGAAKQAVSDAGEDADQAPLAISGLYDGSKAGPPSAAAVDRPSSSKGPRRAALAPKTKPVSNLIELRPGMFANAGQSQAIRSIEAFLSPDYKAKGMAPEYKDLFLLEGGAGVGKTTSINRALEGFSGQIIGATVSDEARGVLQQSMVGKDTLTVAKLLGLVADKTGEKPIFRKRNAAEEAKFRKWGKRDPIQNARLLILDESSMVDEATWKLLMELKPPFTKIIFLGDRTQLPPIGEDLSRVFATLQDTPHHAKLTEAMRFAEGAPIFQVTERLFADNIRAQQKTGVLPKLNPFVGEDLRDVIVDGEAVLYRSWSEGLVKDIGTEFKNATGPKDVVVIADKNESVAALNKSIRKEIFGADVSEDFKIGERVRMVGSYVYDGQVVADNNQKGTVVSKTPGTLEGLPILHVTIEFDKAQRDGTVEKVVRSIPIVQPGHESGFKAVVDRLYREALADKTKWRNYYAFKETFGAIDYAYAMTVHKVQGSTYKTVYVMEEEIYRAGTPRTGLELNQMMRTATSRPRMKLVIVTDKITNTASALVDIPQKAPAPAAKTAAKKRKKKP